MISPRGNHLRDPWSLESGRGKACRASEDTVDYRETSPGVDMPQKVKIKAILKAARTIQALWKENPDFEMGDIRLKDFNAVYDAAERLAENHARKRVELIGIKNNRDDKGKELNGLITRFRSGMRAHYGTDSMQYSQSGGTRISERKSRKRKSKAARAR
ncbi:MAG TPA: hypothetical protein VGK77_03970 [Candidatus Binatia bacterium]|jgi:hypothetical protein